MGLRQKFLDTNRSFRTYRQEHKKTDLALNAVEAAGGIALITTAPANPIVLLGGGVLALQGGIGIYDGARKFDIKRSLKKAVNKIHLPKL